MFGPAFRKYTFFNLGPVNGLKGHIVVKILNWPKSSVNGPKFLSMGTNYLLMGRSCCQWAISIVNGPNILSNGPIFCG